MTGNKISVLDPSGRRRLIPLILTAPGDEAMAAIRTVRTDSAEIVRAMGETVRGTPEVLVVSSYLDISVITYTSEKSAISRSKAMGFCNVA